MCGNPTSIIAERPSSPMPKTGHSELTAVVGLTIVFVSSILVGQPGNAAATLPVTAYRLTINPNDAPWWELTVLPRVGDSLAKRIVGFRNATMADNVSTDRAPVAFTSAADLAHVHGIGPKTVARLRSHLHFD